MKNPLLSLIAIFGIAIVSTATSFAFASDLTGDQAWIGVCPISGNCVISSSAELDQPTIIKFLKSTGENLTWLTKYLFWYDQKDSSILYQVENYNGFMTFTANTRNENGSFSQVCAAMWHQPAGKVAYLWEQQSICKKEISKNKYRQIIKLIMKARPSWGFSTPYTY